MKARPVTSLAMIVLPTIIMAFTHITVTPLREMFVVEPKLMYAWYIVGIIIGIIMWKKTRLVKDHEFHRAEIMKGMKEVYAAEEAGVWNQNTPLDSDISAEGEAILKGQVSAIDGERPEMELDDEHKVNVEFLIESKHVQKATMRVTGKESFDSDELESTVGAVRKTSPMDRILDFFGSIFSGKDARQSRKEFRTAQLTAASQANPVVAQRPVAPMQQKKDTESDEIKMTTMSDDGGHETYVNTEGIVVAEDSSQNGTSEAEKVYAWDKEMSANQSSEESLESMAMLGGSPTITSPQISTVAGKQCGSCGIAVSDSDRFCDGCGTSL